MYDMYVPVLCVLSICPHLIIYVFSFYQSSSLSTAVSSSPREADAKVC